MKKYLVIFLFLSISIILFFWQRRKIENFSSQEESSGPINKFVNIFNKVKFYSELFSNQDMWNERIAMAKMTPVELARNYINSQKKK
jgi:hypothetical protein